MNAPDSTVLQLKIANFNEKSTTAVTSIFFTAERSKVFWKTFIINLK